MQKTILIVDDSASIRQVARMTLVGGGYEVVDACDGLDALKKLDGKKVHLIISDLNMPNMDGLTLLQRVKNEPAYRFTPFVMLTSESGDIFMQQGKAQGAKAWMVKPFKPEQLLTTVARLLA
jgi:two-component system chemotaxis response regulator CheY